DQNHETASIWLQGHGLLQTQDKSHPSNSVRFSRMNRKYLYMPTANLKVKTSVVYLSMIRHISKLLISILSLGKNCQYMHTTYMDRLAF
ncbi:MAG: hypothetical protein KKA46_21540, partial [Proteobacteria bacterium]|nr:hypothetical protein [Pseudomonadota bacterium]